MRDYKKIKAWQLADDLTVAIYECTRRFPREELYGVVSQIRRSSYSVPANIAEGSARRTQRDYLHFLYMARGSLTEVEYFIHLSKRLEYLDTEREEKLRAMASESQACLHGLIRAVEKEAGMLNRTAANLSSWIALLIAGTQMFKSVAHSL